MSNSEKNIVFVSYDADSAGRQIGKAVLNDDPDEMSRISERIVSGNKLIERWAKERHGKQYSSGGDQGVYSIDKQYVSELEQLRMDYHFLTNLTISVGIGHHLSESGQALLMAKIKGKNQIVFFDETTKKEIEKIKRRVKKGKFKSMDEYKIAESYLDESEKAKTLKKTENEIDNSCSWCDQTDGVDPEHCQYCHDAESQDGEENCPYCKDMQNDPAEGAQLPEVGEEDCAYCNEQDEEECPYCNGSDSDSGQDVGRENDVLAPRIGTSPDSTNETAPAGSDAEKQLFDQMDMTPPIIGKPLPPDQRPLIGQNAPMDVVPKDPEMEESRFVDGDHGSSVAPSIDPEDNHSKEALHAIAEEIESDGQPDTQEINAIDDSDMPNGIGAEGNVSRPEGFAQNVPQDMGEEGTNPPAGPESEEHDEPDFYNVLETGLDQNADGIKKEKTIRIVSQALMQFKASKATLESMKLQAPDLYAASINMLKAMIEMASMLGMGPSAQTQSQQELGSVQESLMPEQKEQEEQNDEWHDPFPTHPDQGGEAKPGHAPSKNNPSPPKKEGPDSPQP